MVGLLKNWMQQRKESVCPACGSEAWMFRLDRRPTWTGRYHVECIDCSCRYKVRLQGVERHEWAEALIEAS